MVSPLTRTTLGACLLLALAATDRASAQCPDGTPPPCSARHATPAPNSVAVLAFVNAAGDTSLDWLGGGLAEEVATQLAGASGVRVRGAGIVRSAVGAAGGDPRRVGRLVSVHYVVEGSYRSHGPRVRVSARLLALPAGDERWGRVYDRPRDSLATLSDDIAHDLAATLGSDPGKALRRPPDAAAYELYERGRSFHMRDDDLTARRLFEQAVRRDSTFALGWVGLANAWGELADLRLAPLEAYPKAREAARRALALDSTVAGAYLPLAYATASLDHDCAGGSRLVDRAIALDSELPDAWSVRAELLVCLSRGADALDAAQRAWQLDSLSSLTGNYLLFVTASVAPERLPDAFTMVRQRLSPTRLAFWAADLALRRGDCVEAERLLRPTTATNMAQQYVKALLCLGRRASADSVVRAFLADTAARYVNTEAVASALMALGDRDGAMRWLERGADERTFWVMGLRTDHQYAPLHDDPRFLALERRLGLIP